MRRKALPGLLTLLILLTACVHVQRYDAESDFEIALIEGGRSIQIVKYIGGKQVVDIPPAINNLPVTCIGDEAFYERKITGATIPSSVISIGGWAFAGCTAKSN